MKLQDLLYGNKADFVMLVGVLSGADCPVNRFLLNDCINNDRRIIGICLWHERKFSGFNK